MKYNLKYSKQMDNKNMILIHEAGQTKKEWGKKVDNVVDFSYTLHNFFLKYCKSCVN